MLKKEVRTAYLLAGGRPLAGEERREPCVETRGPRCCRRRRHNLFRRGDVVSSSCVRREQRGEPAAPLGLSAGEEVRWRRAVHRVVSVRNFGEAYRSAVSVCWRGVRPASDCLSMHVELWGSLSFRVAFTHRALEETHRSAVSYAGEEIAWRPISCLSCAR